MTNKTKTIMTQQEIWAALVNGEKIIGGNKKLLFKFIYGELYLKVINGGEWEKAKDTTFKYNEDFSIYKEPQWTDRLPCLCWVWDDEERLKIIALVTCFNNKVSDPYQTKINYGDWFKHAEPLTEEDWQKYKAKI